MKIRYIVFSGGAQRGNAFIGALAVLFDFMKMFNVKQRTLLKGFGGTSIGALVALACTLGIQPSKMKEWALQQDTSNFFSQMNLSTFFTNRGLLSQRLLHQYIFDLFKLSPSLFIEEKNYNKITLKELYEMTGLHLKVTASNMTQQSAVVFDHVLTPNCPVVFAVATSMSLPILFEPSIIQQDSRIYMGGGPHDCLIDGGAYDNYPITLFPIEKTIGFQLTLGYGAATRYGHPRLVQTALSKEFSVAEYLGNIISNTVDFYEQRILTLLPSIYSQRTISICIPQTSYKEMIIAPRTLIHSYIRIAEITILFYAFPNYCIYSIFLYFAMCIRIFNKWLQPPLSKNENNLVKEQHQQQQHDEDDVKDDCCNETKKKQKQKQHDLLDNKSNKEECP
jgi:predicted acylesterase/phospholipase RssA